jgi:hypothetical protein
MSSPIEFQLSVQDDQATYEELQAILGALAVELENQAAEVVSLSGSEPSAEPRMAHKGDAPASLLDVKLNLEAVQVFGKWLYGRLVGTTTTVEFDHKGTKFKFEGQNKDLAAAIQNFESFVTKLDTTNQA